MSGSFLGLQIARTGLFVSQKALDVTGKNIANATTEGYTRQRVNSLPAAYDSGVEFVSVEQIRDQFLDSQYRSESSILGEWQVKTDALTSMEDFFQEPSDYGLNKSIGDFFNSLQEMANEPEASEMRSQVRQSAINLTDTLHYLYNKLTELQQNQDKEVETTVNQINNFATNLQSLNEQIARAEIGGQKANELRDQRNNIIDKLSSLVNISTAENTDGTVSVMIGGTYLVDKTDVNLLTTEKKENPITGEPSLNSIKWSDGSGDVAISGGKLKGYLDIRDGKGITETDNPKAMGIPYFIDKLNMFAKAVVQEVNDIHTSGYTFPNVSNDNVSKKDIAFFVPIDAEHEVTAKNISISQDIMNSVYNIASSDEKVEGNNKGNSNKISLIADLRDRTDLTVKADGKVYDIGNFEDFAKKISTELALESSNSNSKLEGQEIIAQSVTNRRASVSGVSIDEEMTNMIQFQHAYSAAARMITTINDNLDILINRMGV